MDKKIIDCVTQAERYLSLREHNTNELKQKLRTKKYPEEIISKTIEYLMDQNELSEERYIREFVRSNNNRHPENSIIVLQRLNEKGADRELSKSIVNEIYTDEYISQMLEKAYEKQVRKNSDNLIKLRQSLIKAGFPISMINCILTDKNSFIKDNI